MSLSAVLRQWWVVMLATIGAIAASLAFSSVATPSYSVSSTYIIAPADQVTETEAIVRTFDSLQGQGIVPTLLEIFSSTSLHEQVSEDLGISTADAEQYEVAASVLSQSNTMELTVTGPDGELTAAFTAELGQMASTLFEDLYPVYQVRGLDEAAAPDSPTSPNPVRDALLAGALGLLVGVGIAALRARSRTVRTEVLPAGGEHRADTMRRWVSEVE